MNLLNGFRDKAKRIKGIEWAMLLIALGLAGSLLLSPGATGVFGGAQPSATAAPDALEARLSRVLSSVEGAGRVEVAVFYQKAAPASATWLDGGQSAATEGGDPAGVIVVAEGADDISVRLELARAVQTLLRLDADAVEIFKMDGTGQEE